MDAFTPGMLVLGRYRIAATTACRPADAAVLARDELLGRFVDLRLLPAPAGTPLGDRFVQRAEGIALLRHPALPLVFDLAPIDDRVLLVSQHVEGTSPARHAGQPPWTLERALRLVERVATALGVAHARGLCHGALRPESIVLGPDDNPVVADFLCPAPKGLTGDEAPELRASAIPTPCSDVFALGRLLWYLLDPYPQARVPGASSGWRAGFISRGKALPREARVLIVRATETRPGDRYADGVALAAAIDGLLSSAVVTGATTAFPAVRQPTGIMPRVAAPRRRRASRRLVALTALAALAGAGAWAGTSAQGKTWANASLLPASRQIAQTWSDLISGFTASPPAPVPVRVHRVIVSAEQRNRAVATATPLPATATPPGTSRDNAPPGLEPSLPTPAAPDPNPGLTPGQPNRGFWPDQPNRAFGPPWYGSRHGRRGWGDVGVKPGGATWPRWEGRSWRVASPSDGPDD